MHLDLATRQTPGIKAYVPIIETIQARPSLADNLRLKAAVAVARNRDLDHPVLAHHRLARIAVAAVAAAAPVRGAFLVSQVLAQLGAECAFQKALLQLLEQSFLPEQVLRRAIALQ